MKQVKKHISSAAGQQTALLFGGQLVLIAIGFGIKKIQTHFLGPEQYGIYATLSAIILFLALFFRFGFFASIQVLIAESKDLHQNKQLTGLGILIATTLGIIYTALFWVISFYLEDWFDITIAHWMRTISPLLIIVPFKWLVSAVAIGSNKVQLLPIHDNVSKVLFIIALAIIGFWGELNVELAVLLNLLTLALGFGVVYRLLEPSYQNLQGTWRLVWNKTKSYGFNFFIGSTINQSTYKLDELAISYFVNTTVNGFYSLAVVITSPLVLASQSLSNSLFKRFNQSQKIPTKVFIVNTAWLVLGYLALLLLAQPVVEWFFGTEYSDVSEYAIGLGIACVFQGLYQPFNFLSAKSQGKMVRNVALVEAVINVIGNLLLIPIVGVMGAIYTSILAKGVHFLGKLYYYQKYLKAQHG